MSLRVHRKPPPSLDADDDERASTPVAMKRQSFTLYADAPLSSQLHQAQHQFQLPSTSPQPHYTRRRTQSNNLNVNPNPASTTPGTPTRTRLARLLLHAPASPTRVRKHTISSPAPTEVPEGMVPPALAALARARPSSIALPQLLPLQLPVISPTASDSGTSASTSSGETDATSPPHSPMSPRKSFAYPSPLSPIAASPPEPAHPSLTDASPRKSSPAPTPAPPASPRKHIAPSSPLRPTRTPPAALEPASPTKLKPPPSSSSSKPKTKPPPLAPLLPPTPAALARAAALPLVAPSGVRVPFGVLLGLGAGADSISVSGVLTKEGGVEKTAGAKTKTRTRRTLVVFLRHFWCPLCQDYMVALASGVRGLQGENSGSAPPEGGDVSNPMPTSNFTPSATSTTFTTSSGMTPSPPPTCAPTPANDCTVPASSSLRPPAFTASEDPREPEREHPDEREARCPACASAGSVTLAYLEGLADGREGSESLRSGDTHRADEDVGGCGCVEEGDFDEGEGVGVGEGEREEGGSGAWAARVCTGFDAEAHAGSDFSPPRTEDHAELGEEVETETHLVLVAPGAHTLIARYLASFGFPAALVGEAGDLKEKGGCACEAGGEAGFDLGDPYPSLSSPPLPATQTHPPPAAHARADEDEGHPHARHEHPTRKRTRPGALKSVRMFVDPRPAEGVYAALGMGWVGVGAAGDEEEKEDGSTDPQSRESTAHAQAEAYFTFPFPGATNPPHDPSTPPTKTTATTPPPDPHADPAYVTHGPLAGVGAVVLRALRAGMPVWARGGDIGLLGGEWVFEVTVGAEAAPSLRCTYAHRMQSPRGHAGVNRVFAAAGLRVRVQGPELEESDIARSKSAITPRGTLKKKDSRGIARSASVDVLGMNTSAPPSVAHTRVPDASTVPRSMSTPPTSSRGISMFTRFAGPKGGRAPASGRAARSLDFSLEQLPRSVSTPPGSRVGVIWETAENDERPRQPALPASLSASSSRPWALAAAGSCASLASASSDSLSFSSKAAERAHPKVASSASASSLEVSVYEPGYVSGDEGDDESERPAFPRREGYATSSEGSSEDASEYGYGYGAPPGEDVWMRARAQSLAWLRARKEMRRGRGQCVSSVDGQA